MPYSGSDSDTQLSTTGAVATRPGEADQARIAVMFRRTYSSTSGTPTRSSTRSTNGSRSCAGSGSRWRTRQTVVTKLRGSG